MKTFLKNYALKILFICADIVILLFFGFQILFPLEKRISPLFETMEMELGDSLDSDITTYIEGFKKAVAQAELDTTQVDAYVAGNYEAYVTLGERTITYNINVVDTINPELVLNTEIVYVATDREYNTQYFVQEMYDLSGTAEASFYVEGSLEKNISFEDAGEYEFTIIAKDVSGNETLQSMTIIADSAPILIGVENATIPIGAEYDFLQSVVALDEVDGEITEQIEVNTNALDMTTEGKYEVVYSIADSYGIETTESAVITVDEEAPADFNKPKAFTLEEMQILCDFEYFTYEPLAEGNYEDALKLVKPTCVNFRSDIGAGTGFIYDITPEYVYIGSVNHVLKHFNKGGTLVFHNDVSIPVTYTYERASSTNELAMLRIEISQIPKETLLTLKEAHVDFEIYEKLSKNEPLFSYSENFRFSGEPKIKKATLIDIQTSITKGVNYIDCCITTNAVVLQGMSGGPVYDYKGNLIGAVSCMYKDKDYHMRIDMLDELRQRLEE